jgi:hypothetical protein
MSNISLEVRQTTIEFDFEGQGLRLAEYDPDEHW